MKLIKKIQWIAPIIIGAILLFGCKKDKVPLPIPVPEPTKWEKIAGHYKVYDTTGAFLYEMDILHSKGTTDQGYPRDTLHFTNFDGQFNFSKLQSNSNISNWPKYYFQIGSQDPVYDQNNKRWALFGPVHQNSNHLFNDSIILSFSKDNIQYYIQDVTPYFYCECKQVAVKQH